MFGAISIKDDGEHMEHQFSRMELLLPGEKMERLKKARVAVFGLGGVGGYTVEALARCGIGTLDIIDKDTICLSNLNRQILALHDTIGAYKADVAAARIHSICPGITVNAYRMFYLPETADQFDFSQYDYVVDAIDTVTGKLSIIKQANLAGVPVISAMGAGNKLDPTAFCVADIYETKVCSLARVMRRELRKMGIPALKVVYSTEPPLAPGWHGEGIKEQEEPPQKRVKQTPGSLSFVPAVAGLILAGEVVRDLIDG